MNELEQILKDAGYEVVSGADAVRAAILQASDGTPDKLCSGFRVFPDGTKCGGCEDCQPKETI